MTQKTIFSGFQPSKSIQEAAHAEVEQILELAPMDSDCLLSINSKPDRDRFEALCMLNTLWGKIKFTVEDSNLQHLLKKVLDEAQGLILQSRKNLVLE